MNTTTRTDTDSIIKTHPYRSGPIGPDGQPRCSSCLAKSDHPAHIAFANAGPFATDAKLAEARAAAESTETWTTVTIEVATTRGIRYQGISYVGEGGPHWLGKLPRGAQVRYTTRLLRSHIEAGEQARSRTIHHNIWHDGSEWALTEGRSRHITRDCHE